MATRIDLGQLQELLDGGGQLVEVLPAAEYADEHLPGHQPPLKQLDAITAPRRIGACRCRSAAGQGRSGRRTDGWRPRRAALA